jgi:hypothetical protein
MPILVKTHPQGGVIFEKKNLSFAEIPAQAFVRDQRIEITCKGKISKNYIGPDTITGIREMAKTSSALLYPEHIEFLTEIAEALDPEHRATKPQPAIQWPS